jgi:hypothetical protein
LKCSSDPELNSGASRYTMKPSPNALDSYVQQDPSAGPRTSRTRQTYNDTMPASSHTTYTASIAMQYLFATHGKTVKETTENIPWRRSV